MKNLLSITCWGIGAVLFGVACAYVASHTWYVVRPYIIHSTSDTLAEVKTAFTSIDDDTSISGFTRTIRYTALEEEDIIDSAAQALPQGADGKITAVAYIVKDLSTNTIVAQYNIDKIVPIASITKLVTAIVARKLISPNAHIILSRDILATYGNTASFKVGETFTAENLLYPLLMVSSNDTAEAYAQFYGRQKFIKAMNDFVQSIGAYRTSFKDPSGLDGQNVSTANDLVIILEWIRANDPGIIGITQLKSKVLRAHTFVNPTHFLSWSNYLGGKNGYTIEANRTAIQLFALGRNKDVYAVVILGSGARDPDMIKLLEKVK